MSDAPPLAQEAPPAIDRGDPPAFPLGPEFMSQASMMAAVMLQNLISTSGVQLTSAQAAYVAVELAMDVANEVRMYRLVDNRAVRVVDG